MADRPMLFSAPMVRALLAGTKTQTRRILPDGNIYVDIASEAAEDFELRGWLGFMRGDALGAAKPRYAIGDRLWVKETWRPIPHALQPWDMEVIYNANGEHRIIKDGEFGENDWTIPKAAKRGNVTPLFMPRWASRLTLTVTDVRVERLNDCSPVDALAEGVSSTDHWRPKDVEGKPFEDKWWDDFTFWTEYPQLAYRELWEAINGPGSWEANPWVAAYTFTVERGNIDQLAGAA